MVFVAGSKKFVEDRSKVSTILETRIVRIRTHSFFVPVPTKLSKIPFLVQNLKILLCNLDQHHLQEQKGIRNISNVFLCPTLVCHSRRQGFSDASPPNNSPSTSIFVGIQATQFHVIDDCCSTRGGGSLCLDPWKTWRWKGYYFW